MLIALKSDGRVYLAYNLNDLPMRNFDRQDYLLEDNLPLWKVKKGCIMGYDGEYDEADILRYDARIFRGDINFYNLLENVIPSIQEKLSGLKKLGEDGRLKNDYVIAQGDRAYCITGAGEAEELDDYFCVGTGYTCAMSVLDMTENLAAIDRIKKAFETVEKSESVPAYPIAVMDTVTQKINIIDRP